MSVLCAGLNFDSIIGVWYVWIVSVTGIGRCSKLCISYAAVRTPLFVISDQFVLVQFLAIAETAFQMPLGSLPWATPWTRFLIAQCFRLPLLYRIASMMARTFNDAYCTSSKEPGLGRKTLPIQCFFPVSFRRALSAFGSCFTVFVFLFCSFSVWVCPSGFCSLFVCYFQYFSVGACLTLSHFLKSFCFSENAGVLYRRN